MLTWRVLKEKLETQRVDREGRWIERTGLGTCPLVHEVREKLQEVMREDNTKA